MIRNPSQYLLAFLMVPRIAIAQDLTAASSLADEWITRFQPLEFTLSRPPAAGESVHMIIGTTDVSDLCVVRGDRLSYEPRTIPLPAGTVEISIYIIPVEGGWSSAGSFTVHVLNATGLERSTITPSLSIANKGQPASDHFPDANVTGRTRFQELNGQFALNMELERSGIQAGAEFALVGVSFRQEALRFSEKREKAAKIDLSSYLLKARASTTSLSVGHIDHGRQRHLLSGFASRGISAAATVAGMVDISAAVMNGTNIVGWDNLVGLERPEHRLYSGTVGLEVLPASPGLVRIEASYAHGSQLPISNFNQGEITDAEKSNGAGIRVLLSDPSRTISLDAGFAKARFTNPPDPFLSGDLEIVPVEATTRQARYADVSWNVLTNETLVGNVPARLSVGFRHERVDPLYRAVGVSVRSDLLQNIYELQGGLGPAQVAVTHLRAEDNLADIPSVLKSVTRQTGANLVLSFATMSPTLQWTPTVSYGVTTTHQFGVATPTNSDFTPERVPNQVTTSHTAGIDWQADAIRIGYRGSVSHQDNRQVGNEIADAVNRSHALGISLSSPAVLSFNVEGSLESSNNLETGFVLRTRRLGINLSAQRLSGASASLNGSLSTSRPDDGSSKQKQASLSIEASYAIDLSSLFVFNWRGQMFVRYSWNETSLRDFVFDLDSYARFWLINTGVTFNIF